MNAKTDAQLLREYVEAGSEAAFRELVDRHADLLYSAALRQVGTPDLARDVAQTVFADLARKAAALAKTLKPEGSLLGWLYCATRFAALNQLRDEHRRQRRERQVMQDLCPASESAADWGRVRPVLDEAMSELSDQDREAVLLRYFKNRDFRSIAEALGVSDDAAQKRVSRALEKLHAELVRRGVSTTMGALSTTLGANAVQTAPAGLAAALSTAALSGATAGSASAATTVAAKAIAMTTMHKAVIAVTLIVAVGTGIYQATQAARLRGEVQTLQQQQAPLSEEVQRLEAEADEAKRLLAVAQAQNGQSGSNRNTAELLKLRGEVAQLRKQLAQHTAPPGTASDPFTQSVLALSARAAELNQRLEQMPEKRIPELHFLTEDDWLAAAKDAKFDTDASVRKSLKKLRSLAKLKMPMGWALNGFIRAHNGQLPTDLSQLKPYFKTPSDDGSTSHWQGVDPVRDGAILDAILSRYTLLHTGNISDFDPKAWFVVEKAPVDKDYDTRGKFGNGTSSLSGTGIGEAGDPDDLAYGAE